MPPPRRAFTSTNSTILNRHVALIETLPHQTAAAAEATEVVGLLWVHPRPAFTPLESSETTIGREPGLRVVLEGSQVSRNHAAVYRRPDGYAVKDLQSRNGTYVNGARVTEAQLLPGAIIRVGEWVAVFGAFPRAAADDGTLFIEPLPGLIIGPRSRESWETLERLASSEQPLLLEGPTGTGKEVIARAIHERSGRKGPLVGINCAAIPESLIEAQLFGHAKGAFTGASQASVGLIASADGGTVLLDEIADLPLAQQSKILRAIEERSVLRVGETTPHAVNVRYIAACQRSLWKLSQEGLFRADLVGRLAGGRLRLLPLEQRREEVPLLFRHHFQAAGGKSEAISATAIEVLCLAKWPLNVRQVVQCARLAAVSHPGADAIHGAAMRSLLSQLHADEALAQSDSEPEAASESGGKPAGRRTRWLSRHRAELDQLLSKIKECDGNVSEACRQLEIPRWRAVRLLNALEEQAQ